MIKGKQASKGAMICAGVWIGGLSLLKGFSDFGLTIDEIIKTGVSLAAVFSPVYFSIIMDKIKS